MQAAIGYILQTPAFGGIYVLISSQPHREITTNRQERYNTLRSLAMKEVLVRRREGGKEVGGDNIIGQRRICWLGTEPCTHQIRNCHSDFYHPSLPSLRLNPKRHLG